VPDDRRSGTGGGNSAIPLEVADIFFAFMVGFASSSSSTSATVVGWEIAAEDVLPFAYELDVMNSDARLASQY
jgi:hypothetical protein